MKNRIIVLVLSVFALNVNAQNYNNKHRMYLEIGYCAGIDQSSVAGGVYGAAGAFFWTGNKQSAIDFRVKEVYIHSPEREAGAITLTYRLFLTRGFYLGAGFAHNHEIAMNNYMEDPVGSSMGNGQFIVHRTGLAFEAGYDFKPFPRNKSFGIYPVTGLSCSYMVLDKEPNPLVMLNLGFRFGFKKMPY